VTTTDTANQWITYKKSGQGKNITMEKHVYDYLTSNIGRLRTQNANLSEYRDLVPDEFNASTDEFVDASENITIDQVDDYLQESLMEKPEIKHHSTIFQIMMYNTVNLQMILILFLAAMRKESTTASVNSEQNVINVDHQAEDVKLCSK
jgi:hypothetical protein